MARRHADSRPSRSRRLRCVHAPAETRRHGYAAAHLARAAMEGRMSGRATSFYYSFLALPADKRNAIVAVWDFCRAVDDAVDEPGDRDPASALEQWRAEVARLYEGREPATPQG